MLKDDSRFQQSGVIPYRRKNGRLEILLVTTIRKKKWIIPKGFIEYHLTPFQSAKKEAFEEAGIRGSNSTKALGTYKTKKYGSEIRIKVYSLKVSHMYKDFPERNLRKRKWFSARQAAKIIDVPNVARLIKKLERENSGTK